VSRRTAVCSLYLKPFETVRLLWVELHLKWCLRSPFLLPRKCTTFPYKHSRLFLKGPDDPDKQTVALWPNFLNFDAPQNTPGSVSSRRCKLEMPYTVGYAGTNVIGSRTSFVIATVRSSIHWNIDRGVFRPRQTRQLPRAVDLKGRLLSCQSY